MKDPRERKKPGRKPGGPKTGGRKKGVGNKTPMQIHAQLVTEKAYLALQKGLQEAGFNLILELQQLYNSPEASPQVKLDILELLLKRSIPELKPVEYSIPAPSEDDVLDMSDEELLKKLEEINGQK